MFKYILNALPLLPHIELRGLSKNLLTEHTMCLSNKNGERVIDIVAGLAKLIEIPSKVLSEKLLLLPNSKGINPLELLINSDYIIFNQKQCLDHLKKLLRSLKPKTLRTFYKEKIENNSSIDPNIKTIFFKTIKEKEVQETLRDIKPVEL